VAAAATLVLLGLGVACSNTDDRATTSTTTAAPDPTFAAPTAAPTSLPASTAPLLAAACDGELAVRPVATLPDDLTSISGLAASRRRDDVVWAVEDSFEPAQLVALDTDGRELGRVDIDAGPLSNLDWEAVATTVDSDGTPRVVIGDLGDNLAIRPTVRLLSLDEPELSDDGPTPSAVRPTTIEATFRDATGATVRPNVEAMVVLGDTTWVLDKAPGAPTTIYRLVPDPADATRATFEPAGTVDLDGEAATALDLSPDGSVLALRTNRSLRLHPVEPGADLQTVLAGESCAAPTPPEVQGESVAILAGTAGLLTVSESEQGVPVTLHRTAPDPAG
jgi:hypothetical protein